MNNSRRKKKNNNPGFTKGQNDNLCVFRGPKDHPIIYIFKFRSTEKNQFMVANSRFRSIGTGFSKSKLRAHTLPCVVNWSLVVLFLRSWHVGYWRKTFFSILPTLLINSEIEQVQPPNWDSPVTTLIQISTRFFFFRNHITSS